MPINFLAPNCSTSSNKLEFGLCDAPPPSNSPAYINEDDLSIWIAKIKNPNRENITFYGIDNCVSILRPDGTMESKCDGVLLYLSNLIFVELKSRQSGQGLKKRKGATYSYNQ